MENLENNEMIDIAVFSFQKSSQEKTVEKDSTYYKFVENVFNIMLEKNNVKSNKIGFGGYIEDQVSFWAGVLKMYNSFHVDFDYTLNHKEFDPES